MITITIFTTTSTIIIIITILLTFIGVEYQFTVRKKMATGTFTYNALRTKTLIV